jgi:hypothetical protein
MKSAIALSSRSKVEQILVLIALYSPPSGLTRLRLGSRTVDTH